MHSDNTAKGAQMILEKLFKPNSLGAQGPR